MPSVVVWDAESDVSFASLGGMGREQQLSHMRPTVICAVVMDADHCAEPTRSEEAFATAKKHHWWVDDSTNKEGPFADLLRLFDSADVIVAYNGLGFDFPLIRKYYKGSNGRQRYVSHRSKCLDPMYTLASKLDIRYPKLNNLLILNKLQPKTGVSTVHSNSAKLPIPCPFSHTRTLCVHLVQF